MIDTVLLAIIAVNSTAAICITLLLNRNAIKAALRQWLAERAAKATLPNEAK